MQVLPRERDKFEPTLAAFQLVFQDRRRSRPHDRVTLVQPCAIEGPKPRRPVDQRGLVQARFLRRQAGAWTRPPFAKVPEQLGPRIGIDGSRERLTGRVAEPRNPARKRLWEEHANRPLVETAQQLGVP